MRNKYTGRMSVIDNNPRLKDWRFAITAYARDAISQSLNPTAFPLMGAVQVAITFWMPRPKSHYGTGKNEGILKPTAPRTPITSPDVDKLQRAILDGLTDAGVWMDDAQVYSINAIKVYAHRDRQPGASITVMG